MPTKPTDFYKERGWILAREHQLMFYIQPASRPLSRLSFPDFADDFFSVGNDPGESKLISIFQVVEGVRPETVKITRHRLTRNNVGRISFSRFRQLHPAWRRSHRPEYYRKNHFALGLIKSSDEVFYAVPIPLPFFTRQAKKLIRDLEPEDIAEILVSPSSIDVSQVLSEKQYFKGEDVNRLVYYNQFEFPSLKDPVLSTMVTRHFMRALPK